jgi:AbrB family looped-hinge helix DNA binding protein
MNHALSFVRPISRRGQVVVPKDIRNHLGIRNEVVFEVVGEHVELRASGEGFLAQFLSLPRQAKSPPPATLKAMMEQRDADVR